MGTGCADDSTAPPPKGAGPAVTAPIVDQHGLADDGKALIGPSGERIPIDRKRATGVVDAVTPSGDVITLHGWVAQGDLSGPASAVLAIAGKRSMAMTPSVSRPDVADGYNQPDLDSSGYAISVPVTLLDCSAPKQGLQTFAVTDSAAAPLTWLSNVGEIIRKACRG